MTSTSVGIALLVEEHVIGAYLIVGAAGEHPALRAGVVVAGQHGRALREQLLQDRLGLVDLLAHRDELVALAEEDAHGAIVTPGRGADRAQ